MLKIKKIQFPSKGYFYYWGRIRIRIRSRIRLFLTGSGSSKKDRIRPDPDPQHCRSRTFKAAPAAYFMQAKKKSIVLVSNMTLKAVKKGKYGQKYNCIHYSLFKSSKGKILVCGAGAGAAWSRLFLPGVTFFCLEPEPTQVGWSRLRDLRHLEPEPPKKVAAPQHCWKGKASTNIVI